MSVLIYDCPKKRGEESAYNVSTFVSDSLKLDKYKDRAPHVIA